MENRESTGTTYGQSETPDTDGKARASGEPFGEANRDQVLEGFIPPPGGRRQRSRVRRIRRRKALGFSPATFGASRLRRAVAPGPPHAANWINYAGWMDKRGDSITSLSTQWRVPPDPPLPESQLLYLFNGIEPADADAANDVAILPHEAVKTHIANKQPFTTCSIAATPSALTRILRRPLVCDTEGLLSVRIP